MSEVAARVGVSRQAVYLHFRNRATLLVEMVRRKDAASGLPVKMGAARSAALDEALFLYVKTIYEYYAEVCPVAVALRAAQDTGEDGSEAWRDRMGALKTGAIILMQRYDDAGYLRDSWTGETAGTWVWSRLHFSTWHLLVQEAGWSIRDAVEETVKALVAHLFKDPVRTRVHE